MSYTTSDIAWPALIKIDQNIKDLIRNALELLDDTSSDAGYRMATEVYTDSATVVFSSGEFSGSAAISGSRDSAWNLIKKRRHILQKVYVNDEYGIDLMSFGKVEVTLNNGKTMSIPFAVRFQVDANSHSAGRPRLEEFRGYVDTSPVALALKNDP